MQKFSVLSYLEQFLTKWNGVENDGDEILTQATKKEIGNLQKHIENGCLCNISVSCGSNRNKALHKSLKKNIFTAEARHPVGTSTAWRVFLYVE